MTAMIFYLEGGVGGGGERVLWVGDACFRMKQAALGTIQKLLRFTNSCDILNRSAHTCVDSSWLPGHVNNPFFCH